MYYNWKKLVVSIMWVVIGVTLLVLGITGVTDDTIISGLGGGWLGVGLMQIYRNVKYHTNAEYKEKIDISYTDERNRYIRMKAWSYAGYLFILGSAILSIVLYFNKMTVYGQIISYCMCAFLALFWISYMVLQRKD